MIKVKNVNIGDGVPKICIPVIEKHKKDVIKYIKDIDKLPIDLIEWRADFYEDSDNNIEELSKDIKKCTTKPIIFTLRSVKEGGNLSIKSNTYDSMINIYKTIIDKKLFSIIDIELLTIKENDIKELIKLSKKENIKTILSNHDFNKTPNKLEIIHRIKKMIKLKADIAKVAYTPKKQKDVLTLLELHNEINNIPLITISMGEEGVITRLFYSVITFASAKRASAPGQIEATKLKYMIDNIYKN